MIFPSWGEGGVLPLRHITECKDKEIRRATVRVVTPSGHVSHINRPVSKLFPVEITDREPKKLERNDSIVEENSTLNIEQPTRVKRIAALDADVIRRLRDEV